MHDPLFLLVAGPGDVLRPRREWHADRVHTGHEGAVFAEPLRDLAAHAGHDLHVDRHIRRVRDLDANLRNRDRKSTRLNSSHTVISYAVFCLKKKKKNTTI